MQFPFLEIIPLKIDNSGATKYYAQQTKMVWERIQTKPECFSFSFRSTILSLFSQERKRDVSDCMLNECLIWQMLSSRKLSFVRGPPQVGVGNQDIRKTTFCGQRSCFISYVNVMGPFRRIRPAEYDYLSLLFCIHSQ